MAYHKPSTDREKGFGIHIPTHLQSPNFEGYVYPHDYENDYVPQDYLPKDLVGRKYYEFGTNKTEQAAKAYYDMIRAHAPKRKV
jgi:putative ATPase